MVYTPIAEEMTHIIARKKERFCIKQEGLMAEVMALRSDTLMFDLDGHSLPAGIAVQLAPGVLSDEPEQAHGKEERVRHPRLGLPGSAQDAAVLTKQEVLCLLYWGRKYEGHVIISNLNTYLKCFISVAPNLSVQKSWLSALLFFTEVQMSIDSKSV